MLGLAAAAVLAAGCGGQCKQVVDDAPRTATGKATYGTKLATFTAEKGTIWALGRSAITLDFDAKDPHGDRRPVRLTVERLHAPAKLAAPADATVTACVEVASDEAPRCFALTGDVDVRTLSVDCWEHESGISMCADDADVTIRASAHEDGVDLDVDVHVTSSEHWADATCEGD